MNNMEYTRTVNWVRRKHYYNVPVSFSVKEWIEYWINTGTDQDIHAIY